MLKKYRCAGCFCSRLFRFLHSIFRSSFSAPRSPSGAGFRLGASAFPATSFLGCSVRLPVAASLFPCYAVCLLLLLGLRILLHFAASLFSRCLVLVKHSCFSVVRFAASMFTRCSSAFAFHFLNPIFQRSDRYTLPRLQGHAAGSAVVRRACDGRRGKYAGEDEGRAKAGVENRNESLGQPPEAPDRNTERNH